MNSKLPITLLILLLAFTAISAQVTKLVYEQQVQFEDKAEEDQPQARGILNSFQPLLLSYSERSLNTIVEVMIDDRYILVETRIKDGEGIFSLKYQDKKEVYYLNDITGERKKFDNKMRSYLKDDFSQLKFKRKKNKDSEQEKYKADNNDIKVELLVDLETKIEGRDGLYTEFIYDNHLITRTQKYFKKDRKKVNIKLLSIDQLDVGDHYIHDIIFKNQKLLHANKHIAKDSLEYNINSPDVFVKSLTQDELINLNRYKDNGKYLLVDFWGTWCKPCLKKMPELKAFYDANHEQVDVISLNYNDPNLERIQSKIKEYEMTWDMGTVTEKMLNYLNPQRHFPGLLLFDDEMKLVLRERSKIGLLKSTNILEGGP